jgi:hypothetical protein
VNQILETIRQQERANEVARAVKKRTLSGMPRGCKRGPLAAIIARLRIIPHYYCVWRRARARAHAR